MLESSELAWVRDFHVEIFVNRQVDEQSFVKEIIGALYFIIFYGSFILYVFVATGCREVLHKVDLWALNLSLEREISLFVGAPSSPGSRTLLISLHCGSELCSTEAQWSVIPARERCAWREYVGHWYCNAAHSNKDGYLKFQMD